MIRKRKQIMHLSRINFYILFNAVFIIFNNELKII